MYVHLSGKVDTHLQSSIYNYCHIPYYPKNENTFIVPRHAVVDQRRLLSKIWIIDASFTDERLIWLHALLADIPSCPGVVHGLPECSCPWIGRGRREMNA